MKKTSILVGTVALGLVTATSLYSCNPSDKKTDTGSEKSADAKCGEGKCGGKKDSAMSKTSDGNCGAKAADSTKMKKAEGKCGDAKCGDKKK